MLPTVVHFGLLWLVGPALLTVAVQCRPTHHQVHNHLRQVNEVSGVDTVFVRCVSVCVCVSLHSRPVNQTGQSDQSKTVKAMDFKLDMHVPTSQGQSGRKSLFFRKGGVARVT